MSTTQERPVSDYLAHLPELRRTGGEWSGPCPRCGGRDRFHVREGNRAAVLIGCRKCEITIAELSAMLWPSTGAPTRYPRSVDSGRQRQRGDQATGSAPRSAPVNVEDLAPSDEPPADLAHPKRGRPVAVWRVCRADGALIGVHARFETSEGRKDGMPWWRSGRWSLGDGIAPADLLYGAELLNGYDAERPVYVVEGEKCADLLRGIGAQAVGNVAGAPNAPTPAALAPLARFRRLVVWPDHDDPGRRAAARSVTTLRDLVRRMNPDADAAANVVEFDPESLGLEGEGDDVEQWLEARDSAEPEALRAQLRDATAACAPDPVLGPWAAMFQWSDDVAADVDTPVTPIARFLAFPGALALFAAREKSGKTTLASQAAAAVALGARFGGMPTVAGRAMIITEESPETVARRLARQGARDVRRRIAIADPSTLDQGAADAELPNRVEALAASIEHVRPALVVIDTLDALRAGVVGEASRSDDWPKVFSPLQRAARSTGCGVLILHHAAKHGGGSRDSTAIAASVDLLIEPGKASNGRTEYVSKGRVLDTGDFAVSDYRRESETVRVEALDGTADDRQRQAQRDAWEATEAAILGCLKAQDGATAYALHRELSDKPAIVDAGIDRLLRVGLVGQAGSNGTTRYHLRDEPQ